MKLYHYTSIETLALILNNRQILFNRLDNGVDDLEEKRAQTSELNIANKCYVSCWTHSPVESIALWKLYTNNGIGVRIGLKPNMFDDLSESSSDFKVLIPSEYQSNNCCFPFFSKGNLKLVPVKYVEDVALHLNKGWKRSKDNKTIEIDLTILGATKNNLWSFQEESRFIIMGFPIAKATPKTKEIDKTKEIVNCNGDSLKSILINLSNNALSNLSITLGPACSESHKLIVEALVQRVGLPLDIIKDSDLRGRIGFKQN